MSAPITGGCACGALRYEISAEPFLMNDCQCRDCQHLSGTGHASHLLFPRACVRLDGAAAQWNATGEQGFVKTKQFCPTCGAPVAMTFPAMPEIVAVTAGSLDDPERYAPQRVIWTARAASWDRVNPELPSFEKMPPV